MQQQQEAMIVGNNGDRQKLIETISGYVKEVRSIDNQLKEAEEQLRVLKEKRRTITEYDLPSLMIEHGFNTVKLLDDTKVEVKPFYYARVDKEKSLLFFEWLRNNGHGGIIKNHFEVWERRSDIVLLLQEFCKHYGIECSVSEDIHWKTLEKWFQEVTTRALPVDVELFTNHVGSRAVIK